MVDPSELCQTERVPLGQRRRVSRSNLSPAPLCQAEPPQRACLSASSEGLNQLFAGKNKASSSSADQNCSAQITFMKYLSSLAGEISILMAHQAQLSQIMKIHLCCQSTAAGVGLAPSSLARTKTCYCSGVPISNAHFKKSADALGCPPSANKDRSVFNGG